jgi:hypothetical protein
MQNANCKMQNVVIGGGSGSIRIFSSRNGYRPYAIR